MVQFWITLQKLVQYNIKIIFGNKFLYFMLSALAFYIITVVVKLLGEDEITQATAYSMLMLPSILLVFYPLRHTERPGCEDRGNHLRNPEL